METTKELQHNLSEQDIELALRSMPTPQFFPTPEKLSQYEKLAQLLIAGGLGIKDNSSKLKEVQIAELELKLMYCEVHDIPAIYAQSIYPVNGKCEMEVDVMMWCVKQRCPYSEFETTEYSRDKVRIRTRRSPLHNWIVSEWTIDKVRMMLPSLLNKSTWKSIPDQMLRSRCYGDLCRTVYMNELKGAVYARGEISDNIPLDNLPLQSPGPFPPKSEGPIQTEAKIEPKIEPKKETIVEKPKEFPKETPKEIPKQPPKEEKPKQPPTVTNTDRTKWIDFLKSKQMTDDQIKGKVKGIIADLSGLLDEDQALSSLAHDMGYPSATKQDEVSESKDVKLYHVVSYDEKTGATGLYARCQFQEIDEKGDSIGGPVWLNNFDLAEGFKLGCVVKCALEKKGSYTNIQKKTLKVVQPAT